MEETIENLKKEIEYYKLYLSFVMPDGLHLDELVEKYHNNLEFIKWIVYHKHDCINYYISGILQEAVKHGYQDVIDIVIEFAKNGNIKCEFTLQNLFDYYFFKKQEFGEIPKDIAINFIKNYPDRLITTSIVHCRVSSYYDKAWEYEKATEQLIKEFDFYYNIYQEGCYQFCISFDFVSLLARFLPCSKLITYLEKLEKIVDEPQKLYNYVFVKVNEKNNNYAKLIFEKDEKLTFLKEKKNAKVVSFKYAEMSNGFKLKKPEEDITQKIKEIIIKILEETE